MTENTGKDAFSEAFEALLSEEQGEAGGAQPKETTPAQPDPAPTPAAAQADPAPTPETPAQDEPAKDEPAGDGAAPKDEPAKDEPAPTPEGAAPKDGPAAEADDVLVNRLSAALDKVAKAREPAPKEEPAPTPEAQAPPPVQLNAEDNEFLATFGKEWPDVQRAMDLYAKVQLPTVVNHIFAEMSKVIAPMNQTLRYLAERTQLTDLQKDVPDYDTVVDRIEEWVDQQPDYLKPAYQRVIANGTVAEVKDLIERFRKDTGTPLPTQEAPAAPAPKTELPAATRKAVAALAPVGSKRSVIPKSDDPNDFDAAFKEFAASE